MSVEQIKNLNNRVSNIEKALHKLESCAPWEQHRAGIGPQAKPHKEDDSAGRKSPAVPQVKPAPRDTDKTKQPWYKTLNGWKAALEVIAIPFAVGYALVTWLQWRDLRHNFEIDQR